MCYIQGRDVRMCGIIGVGSTVSGEVRGWGTRSWNEGKRKRGSGGEREGEGEIGSARGECVIDVCM